MRSLGVLTGADLRARDLVWLTAHFGKAGAWWHALARGEDERPVRSDRARKSSGSETTFARDLTSPQDIEAGVLAMAEEVWAWCARARAFGRTVTVKVKFADFRLVTRRRTVARDITDPDALRSLSLALVRTLFPVSHGVRLVGVTVSGFAAVQTAPPPAQLDLDLTRPSGPLRAPSHFQAASAA
jgi:DNA polymerase-4